MGDEIQIVKKRARDEDGDQTLTAKHESFNKRHKSYDADHVVISDLLLIQQQDEPEYIIIINEQQEEERISDTEPKLSGEDDVSDSVLIRHLLEASDDELGLPSKLGELEMCVSNNNCGAVFEEEEEGVVGMDGVGGHFWEIEDEAANYYALMQSQLFM